MPVLHELLAVESDAAGYAEKVYEEAATTFTKKPDHFKGNSTSVIYLSDDRQNENISESKEIVSTVQAKLDYVNKGLARLWDVYLQRDLTNTTAFADLVIDGVVLAPKVPGIFLLMMEKRLSQYRNLLQVIPTLEPAIAWHEDPTRGEGIFKSPVRTTMKTEKVLEHKILVAATDKHPAQVEKWTADVNVARSETTHFSGMWSVAHKSEVLGRLDKLLEAVKTARMRANLVEVVPAKIGSAMLDYVMKGSLPSTK